MPRACRRFDADLILHPKFTVPLLTRVPTVMVLHGADWFLPDAKQFYGRLDRAYMHLFMPLYLRKAAVALSVSQLTTDDFNRIFDLPPGKVRTVYFGPARHFRRITDQAALAAVREKYGLPERFILTLSKVGGGERKNIRGVFEAYARLHGKVPHKLVVGGKDLEGFRREYDIPDTGWGRDVLFPGYLDQADLPAIYSASDLYLYPSNQEAFPIPLTEAMACGTPIVTSRANGLEEIAGPAALLVDPRRSGRDRRARYSGCWATRNSQRDCRRRDSSGRERSPGTPARGARSRSSRRSAARRSRVPAPGAHDFIPHRAHPCRLLCRTLPRAGGPTVRRHARARIRTSTSSWVCVKAKGAGFAASAA